MAINRTGIRPAAYLGVTAGTPPQFERHDRAPTSNDYANFIIGTLWLDFSSMLKTPPTSPINRDIYMLVAKKGLVATWLPLSGATSETLTGDDLVPVTADANDNINVFGVPGRISTTGNPGTNTITWDIGTQIADTYTADTLSATPVAHNLNVLGGLGIDTSGSGNTITIDSDGVGALSSFFATISTTLPNVIGDTAGFDVPFDTTIYDLNSDFNTGTGKFVAPHDGIYLFTSTTGMGVIDAAMTNCSLRLIVNGGAPGDIELRAEKINPVPIRDQSVASDQVDITIFGYIKLDANDTVKVTIELDGGAGDTATIVQGGVNDFRTWFQGSLIALT